MNRRDYLLSSITDSITWFFRKKNYFRFYTHFFRVSAITLSGGLTILAGIQIKEQNQLISIVILVISAAITMITSMNNIYKPNDSWIQIKKNLDELRNLKREIEYKTEETQELPIEYFHKYLEILEENTGQWLKTRLRGEKNRESTELMRELLDSKQKK